MKKNDQDTSLFERQLDNKQKLSSESFKTTNVNILLNRLITTRQQQDLDSQTDINGSINPFLRMIL